MLSRARLDIPGQVAKVDPTNCVAGATCVKVCPYGAPMINDMKKAEIRGATCIGCGSCAVECPAHAITLQHQADGQMTAAARDRARALVRQFPSDVNLALLLASAGSSPKISELSPERARAGGIREYRLLGAAG